MSRQLVVFFALAWCISWIIWSPLYLPALGWQTGGVWPFQHALGAWGPMLAAFITTLLFEGKNNTLALLRAMIAWRPLGYTVVALFSPFLLNVLAGILVWVMQGYWPSWSGWGISQEHPGWTMGAFFLYNLVFFGFGEEVGWRGFALPRFQSRFSALTSSVFLGIFWAIWHWPLFLYRPGYVSMGWDGAIGWLLSMLTGSVLLTWLFNGSRGSILACAIFHATIDIAFTSDFADKQIVQYTGMWITCWGLATILVYRPAHLAPVECVKHLQNSSDLPTP